MAERAIFLLRDNETADLLMEIAGVWGIPCKKMDKKYVDTSLVKLACTAGALIEQELNMWPPKAVALQVEPDMANQIAMDLRMRSHDGVMAAFWFSEKLQESTAFMVLTCNRIKNVLNGINSAERFSMLHAKAAMRRSKRESILGALDLSLQRAAAEQEREAVMSQVRAEVQAALI